MNIEDAEKEKKMREKLSSLSTEGLLIEIAVSLDKISTAVSGRIPAVLSNSIAHELKNLTGVIKSKR